MRKIPSKKLRLNLIQKRKLKCGAGTGNTLKGKKAIVLLRISLKPIFTLQL